MPVVFDEHCDAHKLALAAKNAAEDVDYLAYTFESLLNSIHNWFDNRPTKEVELRREIKSDSSEREHAKAMLELCKSLAARWLSSEKSVRALRSILPHVLVVLEREKVSFTKKMKTFKFVATVVLWCHVLPEVCRASKEFQTPNQSFSEIERIINQLCSYVNGQLQQAEAEQKRLESDSDAPSTYKVVLDAEMELKRIAAKSIAVVDNKQQRLQFNMLCLTWLRALLNRLQQRFPASDLFRHLSLLFAPNKLPKTEEENSDGMHGVESLDFVLQQFNKPLPPTPSLIQQLDVINAHVNSKGKAQQKEKPKEKFSRSTKKGANGKAKAKSKSKRVIEEEEEEGVCICLFAS